MKIYNPFRTALVATLGVGLGVLIIQSTQSLSTILLYVGTALFLALGLDPAIAFLTRRGMRRWLAVLITILLVLGVFAGLVLIVLPVIMSQVTQLVSQVSDLVSSRNVFDDVKAWLGSTFPNLDVDIVMNEVQKWLLSNMSTITQTALNAGVAVVGFLAGAFIVLILTIYFTASIPSLKSSIYRLAPASKRARFIDLAEQITDSVGYYVRGQVTLGFINGILSAIYLSIIQAPFPAVLAVIAFLFSLLPMVGTLTGSTLNVLLCFLPGLGSITTGIAAGIYYLIYLQIEAYFIAPRIMNRAVAVPAVVVVVAALSGGALLGLLGALIAIPVAASVLIIYRQVLIPRQNER